jgi:hypothetical protein
LPEKVITEAITSSQSWRRLSDPARALFVPLLVKTDQWGIRKADLEGIRFDCIPGLEWPDTKLLSALEEYVREDMIELYLDDGRWYLRIINHDRFQRALVRLRKGKPRYPLPTGERSTNDRRTIAARWLGMFSGARGSGLQPVKPEDLNPGLSPTDPPGARDNRNGLRFSIEQEHELWTLGEEIADADEGTLHVFRTLRAKGLPPAAFAGAREALLERRRHSTKPPLRSEARFVMSELKRALDEGRYAA